MLSKRALFLGKLLTHGRRPHRQLKRAQRRSRRLTELSKRVATSLECLEDRWLLSATPVTASLSAGGSGIIAPIGVASSTGAASNGSNGGSPVNFISPAELRAAYGITEITSHGQTLNGAGETIAIVDAYNDADIIPDANAFSTAYGLPGFNGSGEPTLTVLNENGGLSLAGIPSARARSTAASGLSRNRSM